MCWAFRAYKSRETHLEQHGGKHPPHGLVEASNRGLQHRGHQDGLVEVLLCDHRGSKFEKHQHLASTVPRVFNLARRGMKTNTLSYFTGEM